MIGPISWPIQVRESETDEFDLYFFEFETSRYIVGVIGDVSEQPIPLRIESACIFGHVFAGRKCDCGDQFEMALEAMIENGHGIVAYGLDDDARGHGIETHFKLYEYRQHDGREDEREIFDELGMELDVRDYSPVIEILDHFGIESVKIMTNNSDRINALSEGGIEVAERIPLEPEVTTHNETLLLQEKEWLGYETSYKTLDEWVHRFREKQNGSAFGCIVTSSHAEDIASIFSAEEPTKETLRRAISEVDEFTTMLTNFEPPQTVKNDIDKLVIVDEDHYRVVE